MRQASWLPHTNLGGSYCSDSVPFLLEVDAVLSMLDDLENVCPTTGKSDHLLLTVGLSTS
jgi:hypothetical protein